MSLRSILKRSRLETQAREAAEDEAANPPPPKKSRRAPAKKKKKPAAKSKGKGKAKAKTSKKKSVTGRFRPKGYTGPTIKDDDDEDEDGDDSDDSDEVEDSDDELDNAVIIENITPEDLYKDDEDRARLLAMNEFEREAEMAERYEDKRQEMENLKTRLAERERKRAARAKAKAAKKTSKKKGRAKKAAKAKAKSSRQVMDDDDSDDNEEAHAVVADDDSDGDAEDDDDEEHEDAASARVTRSASGRGGDAELMPSERLKRQKRAAALADLKNRTQRAKKAAAEATVHDSDSESSAAPARRRRRGRRESDDDFIADDDEDDDDGSSGGRGRGRSRSRSAGRRKRRSSRSDSRDRRSRSDSADRGRRRRRSYSSDGSRSRSRDRRRSRSYDSRSRSRPQSDAEMEVESPELTVLDMNRCRFTRYHLAKWCDEPFFKQAVKDAWVRVAIGQDGLKNQVYKACRVKQVVRYRRRYRLERKGTSYALEVSIGNATKVFRMDLVSNHRVTQAEFDAWASQERKDKGRIPTQADCVAQANMVHKLTAEHTYNPLEIKEMVLKRRKDARNISNLVEAREKVETELKARQGMPRPKDEKEARKHDLEISELGNQLQAIQDEQERRMATVPKIYQQKHSINKKNYERNLKVTSEVCYDEDKFVEGITTEFLETNSYMRRPNRPTTLWVPTVKEGEYDVEEEKRKEEAAKAAKKAKEDAEKAAKAAAAAEAARKAKIDVLDLTAEDATPAKRRVKPVADTETVVDLQSLLGKSKQSATAGASAGSGTRTSAPAPAAAPAPAGAISFDDFLSKF